MLQAAGLRALLFMAGVVSNVLGANTQPPCADVIGPVMCLKFKHYCFVSTVKITLQGSSKPVPLSAACRLTCGLCVPEPDTTVPAATTTSATTTATATTAATAASTTPFAVTTAWQGCAGGVLHHYANALAGSMPNGGHLSPAKPILQAAGTVEACAAACLEQQSCKAFQFNAIGKRCQLSSMQGRWNTQLKTPEWRRKLFSVHNKLVGGKCRATTTATTTTATTTTIVSIKPEHNTCPTLERFAAPLPFIGSVAKNTIKEGIVPSGWNKYYKFAFRADSAEECARKCVPSPENKKNCLGFMFKARNSATRLQTCAESSRCGDCMLKYQRANQNQTDAGQSGKWMFYNRHACPAANPCCKATSATPSLSTPLTTASTMPTSSSATVRVCPVSGSLAEFTKPQTGFAVGFALARMRTDIATAEECASLCLSMPTCKAFQHSAKSAQCGVKSSIPGSSTMPSAEVSTTTPAEPPPPAAADTTEAATQPAGIIPAADTTPPSSCDDIEQFDNGENGFHYGNLVVKEFTGVANATACATLCVSADTCTAFNYFSNQQKCGLKSVSKVSSELLQATDVGGKAWQSKYVYYRRILNDCPGSAETTAQPSAVAAATQTGGTPATTVLQKYTEKGSGSVVLLLRAHHCKHLVCDGTAFAEVNSVEECALKCAQEAMCLSFSYYAHKNACRLSQLALSGEFASNLLNNKAVHSAMVSFEKALQTARPTEAANTEAYVKPVVEVSSKPAVTTSIQSNGLELLANLEWHKNYLFYTRCRATDTCCASPATTTHTTTTTIAAKRNLTVTTGPPHIFFFLADDLSYGHLQSEGNVLATTPALDSFARNSIKFTRMHSPIATCAPARAALFTGMYPARSGAIGNHAAGQIKKGVRTLPTVLQPLGYTVALGGKRHFNPMSQFPFEFYTGDVAGDADDSADIRNGGLEKYLGRKRENLADGAGLGPMALVYASNEPHGPHTRDKLTLEPWLVVTTGRSDPNYPPKWPWNAMSKWNAFINDINKLDRQFEYWQNTLRQNFHRDDKWVKIFTSDHGSAEFGKWSCYDQGLRVPFYLQHNGFPELGQNGNGRRVDHLLNFVDILPTLIDLGGATPNTSMYDGFSILPVLKDPLHPPLHEYVYGVHTSRGATCSEHSYPIRSISSGRFKLIRNFNHTFKLQTSVNAFGDRGAIGKYTNWQRNWLTEYLTNSSRARWVSFVECRPVTHTCHAPFFKMAPKNHDLRSVLLPAPEGAGCRTCLESRM